MKLLLIAQIQRVADPRDSLLKVFESLGCSYVPNGTHEYLISGLTSAMVVMAFKFGSTSEWEADLEYFPSGNGNYYISNPITHVSAFLKPKHNSDKWILCLSSLFLSG